MSTNNNNQLPTTTTFLPILDDLLSPDFRPVTHPPVITPLQTPTTVSIGGVAAAGVGCGVVSSSSNVVGVMSSSVVVEEEMGREEGDDEEEAVRKIQKWWKKSRGEGEEVCDAGEVESVKHSIRHKREEEHIRYLECELSRLKSSLSAERKLRSLQYEAIRSLWSQVQTLSVNNSGAVAGGNNSSGVMSQSCPNGLPGVQPTRKEEEKPCGCTTEIRELKDKIEKEMGELRSMVELLVSGGGAAKKEEDSKVCGMRRPDTLDLGGGGGGKGGVVGEEVLEGYADSMAKFVVERGLSDNNNSVGDEASV